MKKLHRDHLIILYLSATMGTNMNSGLYSLLNNKQISKISKHLFHGYLGTGAGDL